MAAESRVGSHNCLIGDSVCTAATGVSVPAIRGTFPARRSRLKTV